MLRKLGLIAVGLVVVVAGTIPQPVNANHQMSNFHYKRGGANSHTYDGWRFIGIHNGANQDAWMQDAINEAADRWTDTNWHPVILAPSNLPPSQWPWPCDYTPPPDGWGVSICFGDPGVGNAAVAQWFFGTDGHVRWVKITLREGLENHRYDDIITHELGHALGLAHRAPACATVMSSDGGCGYPDAHDQDQVALIYQHLHSS